MVAKQSLCLEAAIVRPAVKRPKCKQESAGCQRARHGSQKQNNSQSEKSAGGGRSSSSRSPIHADDKQKDWQSRAHHLGVIRLVLDRNRPTEWAKLSDSYGALERQRRCKWWSDIRIACSAGECASKQIKQCKQDKHELEVQLTSWFKCGTSCGSWSR